MSDENTWTSGPGSEIERLRRENETLKREVSRLKAELALAISAVGSETTRRFRPMGGRSFKPRG